MKGSFDKTEEQVIEVSYNPVYAMDRESFEALIAQASLGGLTGALDALVEHGVVVPLTGDDARQVPTNEAKFYALQLFILHRYASKTRSFRHPWAAALEEPSQVEGDAWLEDLGRLSRTMTSLVARLRGESSQAPRRDAIVELFEALERTLEALEPLGALGHVFQLMRHEVLDTMRGDARLYGEFCWGLKHLRELYHSAFLTSASQRDGSESIAAMRATQDMDAISIDAVPEPRNDRAPDTSPSPPEAVSEELEAPAASDAPSTPAITVEAKAQGEVSAPQPIALSTSRVTAELPAFSEQKEEEDEDDEPGSGEEPSDPGVEQEQEAGEEVDEQTNPFIRARSPSTQQNVSDLQKRLNALRQLDGKSESRKPSIFGASSGSKPSSLAQKAIALSAQKEDRAEDEDDRAQQDSEVKVDGPRSETLQDELLLDDGQGVPNTEELAMLSSSAIEIEEGEGSEEEFLLELHEEAALIEEDDELLEDMFDDDSETVVLNSLDMQRRAEEAGQVNSPLDVQPPPVSPDEEGAEALTEAMSDEERQAAAHQEWQRQIQELNAKREAYMQDQNWSGLVQLYEEGIELFEAQERQQVYLTLARLYELKMQDTKKALESMALAFEVGGADALLLKIIEAMGRFGQGPARTALMAWVDAQLGAGEWSFPVTEALQRMRALLLQEGGDGQRAFLMYASFVADSPELAATDGGLDFLEGLAQHLDATELYDLYDDLIEHTLDQALLYHLHSRAGFFAMQRDELGRALPYLERAMDIDPGQEQIFHVLSQLYEERGDKSSLLVLFERRSRALSGAAQDALRDQLKSLREDERQNREHYLAEYTTKLERSPQDDVLLECIMRSYLEEERHIDAYAFLNRHLDKLTAVSSRVRARQTLGTLALQYLHSPEEAIVHLEDALELGGAKKSLLESLIMINLEQEDWARVLLYIERLTHELFYELSRDEQVRWLLAGAQAAQSLDNMNKEKDFLERTLAVDPDHEQARQALDELS